MAHSHSSAKGSSTDGRQRLSVAMKLQAIEGNPLSAEQVEMFEMFEREGWSNERCMAYILARVRSVAAE